MLLTIILFAREHLTQLEEDITLRDQHFLLFLNIAKQKNKSKAKNFQEWIDFLKAEMYNYQAALDWGINRRQTGNLIDLLDILLEDWCEVGKLVDLKYWLENIQNLSNFHDYQKKFFQLFPIKRLASLVEYQSQP